MRRYSKNWHQNKEGAESDLPMFMSFQAILNAPCLTSIMFNLQYVPIFNFVTFSSNMVIECSEQRLQGHTCELFSCQI